MGRHWSELARRWVLCFLFMTAKSPLVNCFISNFQEQINAGKQLTYFSSTKRSTLHMKDTPDHAYNRSTKKSTKDVLNLESIRGSLIRQEETIIFAMIERAQFSHNRAMYENQIYDIIPEDTSKQACAKKGSFLEYILCETEKLHARVRRYTSPEEYPFFPEFISDPILPALDFPSLLYEHSVNLNPSILKSYLDDVLPRICPSGDDEQYGSSAINDIAALQALSKRVHYGLFVAESKFQERPEEYTRMCQEGDAKGVYDLLTNKIVEEHVLKRAFLKASTYGQDIDINGQSNEYKVRPTVIAGLYKNVIIPLTKEVEVLYLFERVGCSSPNLIGIHN